MKPEAQLIALLDWMGWKDFQRDNAPIGDDAWFAADPPFGLRRRTPSLTLDLMHKAVRALRYEKGNQFQWLQYTRELFKAIWGRETEPRDHISDGIAWDVIEATKEQRLEALLKTIAKWDSENSDVSGASDASAPRNG